ncbi:MAG TPA: hypothetical protein VLI93_04845 [Acetobacteraceae bacterium]|nr:hypothetical protein [Acetobacteraceae bacterium]
MHRLADAARSRRFAARLLLILLTCWALLDVAPDLIRLFRPLGSLGFAANNDGLIYDVQGPFAALEDSPAWQAGMRPGDRIDLSAMRCVPVRTRICADTLAVFGGLGGAQRLRNGRTVVLVTISPPQETRLVVTVTAARIYNDWMARIMLALGEAVAILVITGAAWLVWTRPGPMTWGFFLYVMWFNPGSNYQAYAFLQERPTLLLAQEVAQALATAAGYAGFLLFALRVPRDQPSPAWKPMERALPLIAVVLAIVQLASFASAFGYRTEFGTRTAFILGWCVDLAALFILLARRHGQPPQDYQRLRWVVWGCLIGLPSFIFAELSWSTTLLLPLWGGTPPSDAVLGLFYLLNGIMAAFIFEAVRRRRVIDVSIPLRRVTLFALLVSAPMFWLGEWISGLQHHLDLPLWAWLLGGSLVAFVLTKVHHLAAELAHHVLSRSYRRAHNHLEHAAHQLRTATTTAEIERRLIDAPAEALRLASAALFRAQPGAWARCPVAIGWDEATAARLAPDLPDQLGITIEPPQPKRLAIGKEPAGFPHDLQAPVLCVPIGDGLALAFYGPHRSGADLNADERDLLARFVTKAAAAYSRLEIEALRARVRILELNSTADEHLHG